MKCSLGTITSGRVLLRALVVLGFILSLQFTICFDSHSFSPSLCAHLLPGPVDARFAPMLKSDQAPVIRPMPGVVTPKYGADIRSQAAAYGFYLPEDFLDESQSFGLKRIRKQPRTVSRAIVEQCLSGRRVAVVGNSHVQHAFLQVVASLSYSSLHATYFLKGANYSLRSVVDTAVFSSLMSDSAASILLRRGLHSASQPALEAFRHDVVFVNRGVWDVMRYNTDVSVIGTEFYEALKELFEKWVKRRGGKIVVMPMYGSSSKSQCLSFRRVELARLAVFAAVHRFAAEKESEVVVTTPDKIDGNKVNVLIFDMYDFLLAKGNAMFDTDGHHMTTEARGLIVTSWLTRVIRGERCDAVPSTPAVDELVKSAFLSSTTRKYLAKSLSRFWEAPVRFPPTTEPCGCLAATFESTHPSCNMPDNLLSRQRRHALVQYLLKYGIRGAAEAQVHEMINTVCDERYVLVDGELQRQLRRCRQAIGVAADRRPTDEVARWVVVDRNSQPKFPGNDHCLCQNDTSTIHNASSQHCASVATEWLKNKASCIYMDSDANFDQG